MTSNKEIFFQTAYSIAKHLAKEAIWYNNTCNWTGHQVDAINGSFKVVTTSFSADPYNGLSGIATFLSMIVSKTNDPILTWTLEGTVNNVIQILQKENKLGNYGVYAGKLGAAYHLWKIGRQQNRPEWSNLGLKIIAALAPIALTDHEIDIISGAAGAIPVLLELHQEEEQDVFLEMAKKCGDFLIEKAQKDDQWWYWLTIPTTPYGLTGYSHGAAGIALGLLELGVYTQEDRYLQAATMGFNYEQQWFDAPQANWPDLREYKGQGPTSCSSIWCHGAPGIALSRLRAYELTQNESYKQAAQIALKTTYQSVLDMLNGKSGLLNFSICHGIAGNSDILLSGAEVFDDPNYRSLAEYVGQFGNTQFGQTGIPWPSGVNDPSGLLNGQTETPGLMLGLAGTGYFFLRLAFPKEFKSALLAATTKKNSAALA
ncbi:lanthionine synthetase LanC family protein [Aureispira anguillae]|uniref:Lanthionine synthetase C-like protein n=1 Tax=Aureispira anguillae TaxID=2864201 RepID=A0A915VKH0_9BACT|nr:lanthionine synthetase LanC family protein [Aureispira anguillae]BDS09688.1 hypothetical protein AsAng_0003920 [Aureispira anguillae]